MKKLALATMLASVSTLAVAQPFNQDGLYIQGDVGYSKLQYSDGGKLRDNGVRFGVAVGKDTGDLRYQADATYYNEAKKGDTKVSAYGVGVSAIYDFETTNPMLTPYAGARVGVTHIESKVGDKKKQKDKVGLGVSAGVQFQVNQQIAVDTGVEYNHLGKVDGIKGDQFGAKVGARMNF